MAKKFRPPTIKKTDLERGVRYVDSPQQKDLLGFDVNIGDIVCFAKGYFGSPDLIVGKIAGIYTKVSPAHPYVLRNNPNAPATSETKVSVRYLKHGSVTSYSILSRDCIKLNETQYNEEVKEVLLDA